MPHALPVAGHDIGGNLYPKYTTRNPAARWLVTGFLDALDDLVRRTGAREIHEVGCGEGFLGTRLAAHGLRVRGSDVSPAAIATARARAAELGQAISFRVADLYGLEPERDAAELVVCCEVLEHLPDPGRALDTLARLARPHLIASVPREPLWRLLNLARGKYWRGLGNTPGHLQHWSSARFVTMLESRLEVVEVRTPLDHGVLSRPLRRAGRIAIPRRRCLRPSLARFQHFLSCPVLGSSPKMTRVSTALMGDRAAAGDIDPRVSSGSSTGHGGPSGNPGTEGDRRRRNHGVAALGWLLTGLALGFVGWQLTQGGAWQLAGDRVWRLAPAILLGAIAYALASFLLAEAWRQLLGPGSAPARAYHAVYGRTQIVKYLPGNVFHFAGRQILGRRLGLEQAALALASVAEVLLLLLVATSLAAPLAARWLSPEPAIAWTVAALAMVIAAMLTIRLPIPSAPRLKRWYGESTPTPPSPVEGEGVQLAARLELSLPPCGGGSGWGARFDQWRAWSARITPLRLFRAALLHAAFFAVGGVLLWLVTLAVGSPQFGSADLPASISALALAWMAGFVTPGSSAGFGVREATLIMVMPGSLDREAGVLVALAMRLVTIAGDLLFFAASLALPLAHAHSSVGSATVEQQRSK